MSNCLHVRMVYLTSIQCWPSSQESNWQSKRLWISCVPVMWWARFSITVWKATNCLEFQRCTQNPASSTDSAWTKHLPILPSGASTLYNGTTTRSHHNAYHWLSSRISPVIWLPLLEQTQSTYTSFVRRSPVVGRYPSRSPFSGFSPHSNTVFSPSLRSLSVSPTLSGASPLSSQVDPLSYVLYVFVCPPRSGFPCTSSAFFFGILFRPPSPPITPWYAQPLCISPDMRNWCSAYLPFRKYTA